MASSMRVAVAVFSSCFLLPLLQRVVKQLSLVTTSHCMEDRHRTCFAMRQQTLPSQSCGCIKSALVGAPAETVEFAASSYSIFNTSSSRPLTATALTKRKKKLRKQRRRCQE